MLVPYGGGGLSCGIAAVMRALRPQARVYACEVETAAPLSTRRCAPAQPRAIEHRPSFVDGIGGRSVLAEMWPLARTLLAGSLVVSLAEIAAAVRLLVERNRVVAEGAGAASVAAALGACGARARSSAWSPAATSTARGSSGSSRARCPEAWHELGSGGRSPCRC